MDTQTVENFIYLMKTIPENLIIENFKNYNNVITAKEFYIKLCDLYIRLQIDNKKKTTTVDSVPIASWIINPDGYYPYCSNCGKEPDDIAENCPNCGAYMKNFKKLEGMNYG